MEIYDSKSMSYQYLTNIDIDERKKEILAERLQRINDKLNAIDFERSIYNDKNFLSEIYNKLLKQKEYIENKLQKR